MTPRRTEGPSQPVVTVDEMKAHLRMEEDDADDLLVQSLIDAAVAHFEGYRGVLGRAIMPQTWAVDYDEAGEYRLPMPDVTDAEATAGTLTIKRDALGVLVTVTEPCTVSFECALPDDLLPAVKQAVKLLAGHWYQNREAVAEGSMAEVPLAVNSLIGAARWGRL